MPEINRGVKGHPVSTLGEGCPRTTVKPECKLTAEKILALWRGGDSRCFQVGKLITAPSSPSFSACFKPACARTGRPTESSSNIPQPAARYSDRSQNRTGPRELRPSIPDPCRSWSTFQNGPNRL